MHTVVHTYKCTYMHTNDHPRIILSKIRLVLEWSRVCLSIFCVVCLKIYKYLYMHTYLLTHKCLHVYMHVLLSCVWSVYLHNKLPYCGSSAEVTPGSQQRDAQHLQIIQNYRIYKHVCIDIINVLLYSCVRKITPVWLQFYNGIITHCFWYGKKKMY